MTRSLPWHAEVRAALDVVRSEMDAETRALVEDVRVLTLLNWPAEPVWGDYRPDLRRITVYARAFDEMPDPENRTVQLRDVLRHEFHHALGEMEDASHAGHEEGGSFDNLNWVGRGTYTWTRGNLTITLP